MEMCIRDSGKPSFEEQAARLLRPVTALLEKLFPMSEYRRQHYEADFARLGIAIPPQEYMAGQMARSLSLAILGLAFIPLGIPWLGVLTGIAAILAYFQSMQRLKKRIEALNHAIDGELPRMVGTMECVLGSDRDLIGFFSRYRRVAGKELGREPVSYTHLYGKPVYGRTVCGQTTSGRPRAIYPVSKKHR